jgi:uncharacterized protein (TIGR02453 family)
VFAGFPPEALTFYEGLERDNAKRYWEAHRGTYDRCVREPMELMLDALHDEFGDAKVFRPYRDVRFSKDKTPYKTTCAALLRPDEAPLRGFYVELSARGLTVGGGVWHLEAPQLAAIRAAIDDDARGAELQKIAARLEEEGMPLHAPELKTAPRGYAKDHPRVELLRHRRFAALSHLGAGPWLHTPEAAERVAARWRLTYPLQDWLERSAP